MFIGVIIYTSIKQGCEMSIVNKILEKSKIFWGLKNPMPCEGDIWHFPEYKDFKGQDVKVMNVKETEVTFKLENGLEFTCEIDVFMKVHTFQYTRAQVAGHTPYIPSPLL